MYDSAVVTVKANNALQECVFPAAERVMKREGERRINPLQSHLSFCLSVPGSPLAPHYIMSCDSLSTS